MSSIDHDKFLRDLRDDFAGEAHEQIQSILAGLVNLEKAAPGGERDGFIHGIYRELHNLKGSARAVEFPSTEAICQQLENIFSALSYGEMDVSADLADLLHEAVKTVNRLVMSEEREAQPAEIQGLIGRLNESIPEGARCREEDMSLTAQEASGPMIISAEPAVKAAANGGSPSISSASAVAIMDRSESLRVSTGKLDSILQKTEEMLSTKSMARQQALEVGRLKVQLQEWSRSSSKNAGEIRSARRLLEKLISNTEKAPADGAWRGRAVLVEWQSWLFENLNDRVATLSKVTNNFSHATSLSVDVLVEDAKRLLMMPCSSMVQMFQIVVRDLSRELAREVDFSVSGGEIELDKRILSEVKDPLIHILRNALDHGMELPLQREQLGKPRRGRVTMDIRQNNGTMVEIIISDDGRGIDVKAVKARALKNGAITPEEAEKLTDDEARMLIFRPAFSTAETVTEISGRGLGLAIVEETIRRLGGHLNVKSESGKGTTFSITLPVTIATFRGVLVAIGAHMFLVPTMNIDRVVRVRRSDIKRVKGVDTMLLGNSVVPVRSMAETLELPDEQQSAPFTEFITVCVLEMGSQKQGFIVDQVMEEQEVLVKSLGSAFGQTRNIAGVTILGSGRVVPILNVVDMLAHAKKAPAPQVAVQEASAASSSGNIGSKRVLVVDDTITARNLLRTILHSAGHTVQTANDGVEAYAQLQKEAFDLVVTDVEMPNMNGFELTSKIRADQNLKHLPVVIVTSMTSRADRERGVAAGASAYFVKSSFDQNNLLDVVRRLF